MLSRQRLQAFSDGVFAVIITIMVLQLKLPAHPTFAALLEEWPTAVSYLVSYFLIAIVWINHHFLLGFVTNSTPRLVLWSFAHMLSASLVPFSTSWVAESRIAGVPVFVYAAVIVLLNLVYMAFAFEVLPHSGGESVSTKFRRIAIVRSLATLGLFIVAMVLSLKAPLIAFALVTCVLLTYASPGAPDTPEM